MTVTSTNTKTYSGISKVSQSILTNLNLESASLHKYPNQQIPEKTYSRGKTNYVSQSSPRIQSLPEIHLSLAETSNTKINQDLIAINNNFISQVAAKYTVQEPFEVFAYLLRKQALISVLLEAEKQIRKIFANEKLVLKIVYDPEISNWKKLFIFINTKLDAEEAFYKLKLLDQNWWLDTSCFVHNDLEIHIDFDEI